MNGSKLWPGVSPHLATTDCAASGTLGTMMDSAPSPSGALIAVSADDRALRPISKAGCHAGDGVLHRAFSLFLFDAQGRVLLQQRSARKPLWPGWWANSCCSHPRWGETLREAVLRRTVEELGTALPEVPRWWFDFTYRARYEDVGSEHELCHVFTARIDAEAPQPNPEEVADWRWVTPEALDAELADDAAKLTPWLRIEWPRLRRMMV